MPARVEGDTLVVQATLSAFPRLTSAATSIAHVLPPRVEGVRIRHIEFELVAEAMLNRQVGT